MELSQFHAVVTNTINKLKEIASSTPSTITALNTGEKFQNYVEILVTDEVHSVDSAAKITNKTSKAFPDIVIECSDGTKYGIEVKSSSDNSPGWEIPGNSVNESTLVPGLLEIQLIFGKTHPNRHDFRSALYSDCIKAIKTTHYPRYIVDMDIAPADTIFAQMETTFSEFNALSDKERIQKTKDYYVSKGEYYWWLTDDAGNAITLFENMSSDKISDALAYGFVHFPEELSSDNRSKYQRLAKYIATEYGAVSTCLRDKVSASGRDKLVTANKTFDNVPRVYITMYKIRTAIQGGLKKSKFSDLKKSWGYEPNAGRKKAAWVEVMNLKAGDNLPPNERKQILESIISDS